ncbi:hypothetical protein BJ508DRAFT_359322 [Ascobolus immersus RN42]|uniref:Uncharacterized protein n=1 Tax=Ascobolus immersus RN42 TaxID=1160509 RepID=A0A3N4ITJ5_ASCIM|nr:hypothetical protein BJ508DRAFT_359322 [Ascobolus immersus RN42]
MQSQNPQNPQNPMTFRLVAESTSPNMNGTYFTAAPTPSYILDRVDRDDNFHHILTTTRIPEQAETFSFVETSPPQPNGDASGCLAYNGECLSFINQDLTCSSGTYTQSDTDCESNWRWEEAAVNGVAGYRSTPPNDMRTERPPSIPVTFVNNGNAYYIIPQGEQLYSCGTERVPGGTIRYGYDQSCNDGCSQVFMRVERQ